MKEDYCMILRSMKKSEGATIKKRWLCQRGNLMKLTKNMTLGKEKWHR